MNSETRTPEGSGESDCYFAMRRSVIDFFVWLSAAFVFLMLCAAFGAFILFVIWWNTGGA